MPGPLLAVDAPSLLYRAFYALPKTITDGNGMAGNPLLRTANLVLQAVERNDPRAVVLCFGEEAAHYRVELYPTYHADRIDMPPELVPQWQDAPAFFGAFSLGLIAILPLIVQGLLVLTGSVSSAGAASLQVSGTAILIVVAVALETMRQIDSQLSMREYDR